MLLTLTTNPSVDHELRVSEFRLHDANRVSYVVRDAGGKGINASRVFSALGGDTLAFGFVAGGTGSHLCQILEREGIHHEFTQVPGETRINFSVEDLSGLPPTCFNEPGPMISNAQVDELTERVLKHAGKGDWLLMAGSLAPGLPADLYKKLGLEAQSQGAFIAVDADNESLRHSLDCGPSFLKPNLQEAERLLCRALRDEDEIISGAKEIWERVVHERKVANPIVVISRGSEGACMVDAERVWWGEAPVVQVQSTVGCGDSMVGAMLFALGAGASTVEALKLGLAAGAATAQIAGAGLATGPDIQRLVGQCKVSPAHCV